MEGHNSSAKLTQDVVHALAVVDAVEHHRARGLPVAPSASALLVEALLLRQQRSPIY